MISAADPITVTTQGIINGVGLLGFGAIAVAIIRGLFQRKSLGANATEVIERVAAKSVERIDAENAKLVNDLALERQQRLNDRHEFRSKLVSFTSNLQTHVAWDHLAWERMREAGIDLPEPPPLYPPDVRPGDIIDL